MNEQLFFLILEHLLKANGNSIPANTLFFELRQMTTPMAKRAQFDAAVKELIKLKFIGTERDRLLKGEKLFIKEAGRNYLRDRE